MMMIVKIKIMLLVAMMKIGTKRQVLDTMATVRLTRRCWIR